MVLCFKTWKATKYKNDLTTYFLSVWALSVFSLTCVRVRWCFVYWNAFWLKSQLDVCSEGWSHESLGNSFSRVENDTLWKDLNNGGVCVCVWKSHTRRWFGSLMSAGLHSHLLKYMEVLLDRTHSYPHYKHARNTLRAFSNINREVGRPHSHTLWIWPL